MQKNRNLRLSAVSLHDEPSFECYLSEDKWNGWACPYFTKEQADKLIAGLPEYLRWDGLHIIADLGDDIPEKYSPEMIDGESYWPVGAFGWTWSEDVIGVFDDSPRAVKQEMKIHVELVGGNFHSAATFLNKMGYAEYLIQMEGVGNYTHCVLKMPAELVKKIRSESRSYTSDPSHDDPIHPAFGRADFKKT